jgi:hypothetical protein
LQETIKADEMILIYVDYMNSDSEIPEYTAMCEAAGIAAKITDNPFWEENISSFTHVLLDYGGLNMPGNSMFMHMNGYLQELVENHPNVEFYIISVMGKTFFERELDFNAPNLHCIDTLFCLKELQKILNT